MSAKVIALDERRAPKPRQIEWRAGRPKRDDGEYFIAASLMTNGGDKFTMTKRFDYDGDVLTAETILAMCAKIENELRFWTEWHGHE